MCYAAIENKDISLEKQVYLDFKCKEKLDWAQMN